MDSHLTLYTTISPTSVRGLRFQRNRRSPRWKAGSMLPERTTTMGELDAEATDRPFHSMNAVDRTCSSRKTRLVFIWHDKRWNVHILATAPGTRGTHTKAKLSTCATVVRALFRLEESEDSMMGRLPGAMTGQAVLFESFVMAQLAEYCGEVASMPISGNGRSAGLALINRLPIYHS